MEIEPLFITNSKLRCKKFGIEPNGTPDFTTFLLDTELSLKRLKYDEILRVIDGFVNKMLEIIKDIPLLIIISDENGFILKMAGDAAIKSVVEQTGIKPGLGFREEEAGTNSINLALELLQPVELIGSNHFFKFLKASACYSVPFQYTDNNHVLGTITIMTSVDQHNPFLLPLLCTIVDSIERELLLKKQNSKLHILNQIVMSTTRNGIIITDKEGNITEYNKYAEILTGKSKKSVLKKSLNKLSFGQLIEEVLHSEKEFSDIQFTFTSGKKDEPIICLADAFPIRDENLRILGGLVQFRDITERHKAQEQINYLAFHDELTGLPNRRFFQKYLKEVLEKSEDNKSIFAVMFIDLDRFKIINDNLGHNNGDVLLKMVAKRIKNTTPNETVARLGGDEFTIILQDINHISNAVSMAEQLICEFEKPFTLGGYDLFVTASIGIALYPHDGTNAEMLMKHADIAMYRAKEQGRNNYNIYKPIKANNGLDQLTLESSLRKGLQNEEFELYYQPQIDMKTGQIIGAEALIRWNHPKLGVISPGTFIPVAEETGLIVSIGEWVIREACQQIQEWKYFDPYFKISVNLSVRQFLNQNLVEKIRKILLETNTDPQCLELEVTESMTMDVDHTIEVIGQLKSLGVKISIDDFGTGYSNLYYLKKFSIDGLKIDKSFVRDIMVDTNDADIVATIVAMAKNLGIDVIAEGVETEEQLNFLLKHGCNKAQGYLFHPPIPAEKFALLLNTRNIKGSNVHEKKSIHYTS